MNLAVVGAVLAAPLLDAIVAYDVRMESLIVLGGGILILLAIAAATPVGALRIVWWAVGHPVREFNQNLRVLAGALPLLLLTLGVLFMTTEIWVVATNLSIGELLGTVGLFGGLGVSFLLMVTVTRIAEAASFKDWDEVRDCLDEHPQIGKRNRPRRDDDYGALDQALGKLRTPEAARRSVFRRQRDTHQHLRLLRESKWPKLELEDVPDLEGPERWNIVLVALVGQGFQVLAVSLCLGLFFLAFGLLVVDEPTLEAWQVAPHDGWGPWTGQHFTVAALIATFAGLSYAVSATLLSEQRELFLCQLDHKMQQRLAVRALYRQLDKVSAGSP
jgi:hypothetical protein